MIELTGYTEDILIGERMDAVYFRVRKSEMEMSKEEERKIEFYLVDKKPKRGINLMHHNIHVTNIISYVWT